MPTGKGFTAIERQQIDKAIRDAELICRFEFSLYVGPTEGDAREYAKRLHATLVAPRKSVMVVVDPSARALGIVTGADARAELTDHEVDLAVAQMQSAFAEGDLVGGITRGILTLAEHARRPETLHSS
ncbi:MAG TPA: DUF5130 family protein [Nocardioidaceae bacterium]|nr:DUF5130 family protein [Nocardioidaceae bacterium]